MLTCPRNSAGTGEDWDQVSMQGFFSIFLAEKHWTAATCLSGALQLQCCTHSKGQPARPWALAPWDHLGVWLLQHN